jgi:cytochrome c553
MAEVGQNIKHAVLNLIHLLCFTVIYKIQCQFVVPQRDKHHQICVKILRIFLAGLNKTTKNLNRSSRWTSCDADCVRLLPKGLRVECCTRIYIQWTLDSRTVWCSNNLKLEKKFEKNSDWNSNKNSKVEPWARDCTASCGSCHRESTNKNAASWVLLVGLRISGSRSPVISV